MIRTQDGGVNWEVIGSGESYGLQSVQFIDENLGWSAGYPELLLRSEDGGVSWDTLQQNTAGTIMSLSFSDNDNGWYVTGGGKIYHTENSGFNWVEQTSCSGNFLYDIFFLNDTTGWIAAGFDPFVGNYKNFLYSTSGGEIWDCVEVTISGMWNPGFHSVDFVNEANGWAVGEMGNIIHSEDGGQNWVLQNSGVSKWLTSVDFNDELNGWVVGLDGTILRTIDGGITWNPIIVSVKENFYESDLILYPNPTTNTLNIRYPISDPSATLRTSIRYSMFLYDLYGKQLDEVPISTKEEIIQVDVSSYPTGVYFVVLKDEVGIITRRKFIVN